MNRNAKRRAYEAKRRQEERDRKHREELAEATNRAREEGRVAGMQQGANIMREAVLDHAGKLYKQDKDVQAEAVRAVYRLLPANV